MPSRLFTANPIPIYDHFSLTAAKPLRLTIIRDYKLTQMPLSNHVRGVAQPLQLLRHGRQVEGQPRRLQRLQRPLLPPNVERVLAGEESRSRRCANLNFPDYCDILVSRRVGGVYCAVTAKSLGPAGCKPGPV